jgi:hypothetical protein
MFKVLSSLIILSISTFTWSRTPCKVYGISDGPQALKCSFEEKEVELHCSKGSYYLNKTKVSMAFHMEVETGAVPLVFKAANLTLTVMMGKTITAELEEGKTSAMGICH